jgi:uncharacterized protein
MTYSQVKEFNLKLIIILLLITLSANYIKGQTRNKTPVKKEPIIDVHLHAGLLQNPQPGEDTAWFPNYLYRPNSQEELYDLTWKELNKWNIEKAMISDVLAGHIRRWDSLGKGRFFTQVDFPPSMIKSQNLSLLKERFQNGIYKGFGEVTTQYRGYAPDDSLLRPFFALAEELDLTIGIHMGIAPSGVAHKMPYLSRLGRPLLLEDVMVRHPKLRVYIMHAGWPFLDEMVAMLYAFPNLYVDIAVINWYLPKEEFRFYLKRLIDAGFSKRIMYGSDQMGWPGAISLSIQNIESIPWLTKEQKRDIFYNNAVRFFRLDDKTAKN